MLRIGDDKSDWIEIERPKKGLQPEMFSFYSHLFTDEMGNLKCLKARDTNINNIKYANDSVLMTNTEEKSDGSIGC